MVVSNVRRRRSWPVGDFPMGPTRLQLREVRNCLEYFARSEHIPFRIRRHNGANIQRSIEYITHPVKRMDFFMFHGIVVSIKLRYLDRVFLQRYCYEVLVNRRNLPLHFSIARRKHNGYFYSHTSRKILILAKNVWYMYSILFWQ